MPVTKTPKKWYRKAAIIAAIIGAAATIIGAWVERDVHKNSDPLVHPPPPPPPPTQCFVYDSKEQVVHFKIRRNMTASSLFRLFGVPKSDIMAACAADGVLRAGSGCSLPMPGWTVETYVVQKDDTLFSLERRFNLPPDSAILEWNCLDTLPKGQLIQIFHPPSVKQNLAAP